MSMFESLPSPPEDALHGVAARFGADSRPHKIDLGVGVFRDEQGKSPIIGAVAAAEVEIVSQQHTKSYLPLSGDPAFLSAVQSLVLGERSAERVTAIQTVGGTGGIRLALELALRANPKLKVWVGIPTWPNHLTICEELGIQVVTFEYLNERHEVNCEAISRAAQSAGRGDVLVLHGPCHNPTGVDLSFEQFTQIVALASSRGVTPLVDVAYCGLAEGMEVDLAGARFCLESCPTAFVVLSCSKIFSLYRERTGALLIAAERRERADVARAHAEGIARVAYSMPPAHGAAVVAHVLEQPKLRAAWLREVEAMRTRISSLRHSLFEPGAGLPILARVARQRGIFSLLPVQRRDVDRLASEHAIYMLHSGRINITGLKSGDAETLVQALSSL